MRVLLGSESAEGRCHASDNNCSRVVRQTPSLCQLVVTSSTATGCGCGAGARLLGATLRALPTKSLTLSLRLPLKMAARPGVGPAFVTMDEYDCMIWPGFLRRTVRARCALSSRAQLVVPCLPFCCVSHGARVCAPSKPPALRAGVGAAGARCWPARRTSGPKSSCSACLLSAL